MIDKVDSKRKLQKLVEDFHKNHGTYSAYSEQDTATKFIKPMLEFLRWNLHDMGEVREGVKIDLRSDEQRFFDCVLYSRINSTSTEVHIVIEFKRRARALDC